MKIWSKIKRFVKKWLFPILMVSILILWGILTGWWNMAGIVLALIVIMVAYFTNMVRPSEAGLLALMLMIPAVHKKIKALKAFQDESEERVIEQVRKRENYALFLVREEQLFRGVDSEGKRIRPPYSPYTVQIKRQKNQPTNRVTLLDTGDFYDAMEIVFDPEKFFIVNTDSKEQKLRTKYGADILGLNEQNRDLLAMKIKPDLIEDFKQTVL